VVVNHRWSTTDAWDARAPHSCTIRLLIIEENASVVGHASFLGATAAREKWPIGFNAILIASNVGTTTSLIGNKALATDPSARRKVLQLGFGNKTLTFWGA
jgi:carbonic anhydrase/acetyltransferase-like protein (isoleucine patch superfamily)